MPSGEYFFDTFRQAPCPVDLFHTQCAGLFTGGLFPGFGILISPGA